jgi:hypothetical protein
MSLKKEFSAKAQDFIPAAPAPVVSKARSERPRDASASNGASSSERPRDASASNGASSSERPREAKPRSERPRDASASNGVDCSSRLSPAASTKKKETYKCIGENCYSHRCRDCQNPLTWDLRKTFHPYFSNLYKLNQKAITEFRNGNMLEKDYEKVTKANNDQWTNLTTRYQKELQQFAPPPPTPSDIIVMMENVSCGLTAAISKATCKRK